MGMKGEGGGKVSLGHFLCQAVIVSLALDGGAWVGLLASLVGNLVRI